MDSWRVVILGDHGVGKTALAVRFTLDSFTYDPTLEVAYRRQFAVDDRMSFVEAIDTAGLDEYAALREQWVREGHGFVLVYSIASRVSFDRLEVFRQLIMRVKQQRLVFILVGNQADKLSEREVTREEGAALARDFGCLFVETSAKTAARQDVEWLFVTLVRALRQIYTTDDSQEDSRRRWWWRFGVNFRY